MASKRHSYAVYIGRQLLGRIVLNEATNLALAWDPARRFLGRFEGRKNAESAIEQAEIRRRLDDPRPAFVTGLPEHFLRPR
jgi:hypothetical protein